MQKSRILIYPPSGKGIFHTNMFLKPHMASALLRTVSNLNKQSQFSVSKSQVYPNGLCEIIVRKVNPTISEGAIMDELRCCHNLLQNDSFCSLDETINLCTSMDISDSDDSVCVLSPLQRNKRKVWIKNQSTPYKNLNPIKCSIITKSSHRKVSEGSKEVILTCSTSNDSRTVSYEPISRSNTVVSRTCDSDPSPESKAAEITRRDHMGSVSLISKTSNHVPNDGNSSVVILDVSEDVLPCAPTLGDTGESESSLSKLKLSSMDWIPINKRGYVYKCKTLETNSTKSLNEPENSSKQSGTTLTRNNPAATHIQERLLKSNSLCDGKKVNETCPSSSKCNDLVSPAAISDLSSKEGLVDPVNHGSSAINPCSTSSGKEKIKENPISVQKVEIDKDCNVHELEGNKTTTSHMSRKRGCGLPESHEIVKSFCKSDGSKPAIIEEIPLPSHENNNDSCLIINDDEVIVEKEIPCSSTVHDSDDDIAICEVIKVSRFQDKQNQGLKRKRHKSMVFADPSVTTSTPQKSISPDLEVLSDPIIESVKISPRKKHLKNKNKRQAGSAYVACTSNGSAPDFIPLKPTYRKFGTVDFGSGDKSHDPPNWRAIKNKQKKLQDVQAKKRKKQNALQSKFVKKLDQADACPPATESKEQSEPNGNIINPHSKETTKTGLRPVVIDASNVAISHGRGNFSVEGLKICIKYFTDRGHKVFACAPKFRRSHVSPEDRKALDSLEAEGILSFTPSRTMLSGRKVASYDDRFIVQCAHELGGVIVSSDNYRDLIEENEAWRETIEERLLMPTWVGGMLMFPTDPLGRHGPSLNEFLRFPPTTS